MATLKREFKYKCDNDCQPSGCPGHTATLEFQTTATVFEFKFHKEDTEGVWFDYNSLEALLKMIEDMNESRVDMPQIKCLR